MVQNRKFVTGFNLSEIVKITNGNPVSLKPDLKISAVSTDSRTIKEGELFIALKGNKFDGSLFLADARKKGASACIAPRGSKIPAGLCAVLVDDTQIALASIAKAHRLKFNIPVIAVTGSNGKTTTKNILAHVLKKRYKVLSTDKNYNNEIGVPLTLLNLKDHDMAVVEVGANSFGEIKRNADIIKPTVAIITNIGPSHLEGFKDKHGILREKMALVESLERGGIWIKNNDDMLKQKNYRNIKTISYGIRNKKADFKAEAIRHLKNRVEFSVLNETFSLNLLGSHNVYNGLCAISTASIFMDLKDIREAFGDFRNIGMRTEVLEINGFTLIDDTYNSNPLSFEHAVLTLSQHYPRRRKIVVCADMLELGKSSDRLHYESGKFLADEGVDFLITFGEKALNIARGAVSGGMDKDKISSFNDKKEIAKFLKSILAKGDVLLVKGSRGMKMEEIIDCFTTCSTR